MDRCPERHEVEAELASLAATVTCSKQELELWAWAADVSAEYLSGPDAYDDGERFEWPEDLRTAAAEDMAYRLGEQLRDMAAQLCEDTRAERKARAAARLGRTMADRLMGNA